MKCHKYKQITYKEETTTRLNEQRNKTFFVSFVMFRNINTDIQAVRPMEHQETLLQAITLLQLQDQRICFVLHCVKKQMYECITEILTRNRKQNS